MEGALESGPALPRPPRRRRELLAVDDELGAVKLRLLGSCDGCPSSAVTLQGAVEAAILEAAPEVARIDVEEPTVGRHGRPVPDRAWEHEAAATTSARPRWRLDDATRSPSCSGSAQHARPSGARAEERCELCAEPIADEHGHLVDLQARRPCCAPAAAATCSSPREGAGGGHFRSVPDRYLAFRDFELSPAQWDSLQIPVSVAFFFLNSALERVAAFYPGPAGATESELPARHVGRGGRGQPGAGRPCNPTSRPSSSGGAPSDR